MIRLSRRLVVMYWNWLYGDWWALCLVSLLLVATAHAQTFTPIHVRAGGPDYTDPSGVTWASDAKLAIGGDAYDSGDTADGPLYQTCRWGKFAYHFEVPAGSYALTLHFYEPNYDKPGARVFSISANGAPLLTDFDIYGTAADEPIQKTFTVTASNGVIDLMLIPGAANWPLLSALEITAAPIGPPQLPFLLGPGLISVQILGAPPAISIDCSAVACWDVAPATWPPQYPCPGNTYLSKALGYMYTCAIIGNDLQWQRWAVETAR